MLHEEEVVYNNCVLFYAKTDAQNARQFNVMLHVGGGHKGWP